MYNRGRGTSNGRPVHGRTERGLNAKCSRLCAVSVASAPSADHRGRKEPRRMQGTESTFDDKQFFAGCNEISARNGKFFAWPRHEEKGARKKQSGRAGGGPLTAAAHRQQMAVHRHRENRGKAGLHEFSGEEKGRKNPSGAILRSEKHENGPLYFSRFPWPFRTRAVSPFPAPCRQTLSHKEAAPTEARQTAPKSSVPWIGESMVTLLSKDAALPHSSK